MASTRSRIRETLLTGWEFKDKILRPVIVNLLSASLLFVVAIVFKDRILEFFHPRHEATEWPIYCVVEPEPSADAPVVADLFVMNLMARKYSEGDLNELAKPKSENEPKLSPLIDIEMKPNLPEAEITEVKGDDEFNREKGRVAVTKVSPQHWQLRIEEIRENKILRFVIRTTESRPVNSRANSGTLPIAITYARSP